MVQAGGPADRQQQMSDSPGIEKYRDRLRELLPQLEQEYAVDSFALFGSYVRGEEVQGCDLDVLVTFRETPDLFAFIRLEQYLEGALGIPVDLVMRDALKTHIGKRILREAEPI